MQLQGNEKGGQAEKLPSQSAKAKKDNESLAARIASSATGLARDLAASSSSYDAARTLATGASSSQKPVNGSTSSSAAQSSRWADAIPTRTKGPMLTSHDQTDVDVLSGDGFRSSLLSDAAASMEFNEFTNDYGSSRPSLEGAFDVSALSWASEFATPSNAFSPIDYDDGAAVRALLSQPDDPSEMDGLPMMMDDLEAPDASDLFGENLSNVESQLATRIKSSLPAPPVHRPLESNNPLAFQPDYLNGNSIHPDLAQIQELSESLYLTTGSSHLSAAQKEHFLDEWDDVLNNYADVVWGDMLPTVTAAKTQIGAVREGLDNLDSRAVTRLKMILGHMSDIQEKSYPIEIPQNQTNRLDTLGQAGNATISSSYNYETGQYKSTTQHASLHSAFPFMQRDGYNLTNLQRHGVDPMSLDQQSINSAHQHQRAERQTEHPGSTEEPSLPAFHCPWIGCHEQFENMAELRMRANSQSMMPCPHVGCSEAFADSKDWTEHWQRAHHDLLDTRIPPSGDNNPIQTDDK